jgi:hypothetical protein
MLEKPTWFGKKKIKFFGEGFSLFWEFYQKTGFLDFFLSAKIGPYATFSIYSESAQKTLPENIHFLTFGKFVEISGEKFGGIRFIQKKKMRQLFFSYIF